MNITLLEESSFREIIKEQWENGRNTRDTTRIKSYSGTRMSNGRYNRHFKAKVLRGTVTEQHWKTITMI